MIKEEIALFDREELFQLLAQRQWDELAKILHYNSEILKSDPIIQQAIKLFETEFFTDMESLVPQEKFKHIEFTGLVIELKQKCFSTNFVERFIDEKLRVFQAINHDGLISYAASNQERPLARKILSDIQKEKPESLADASRQSVSIKSNITNNEKKHTIKLFRSKQEEMFFEAVRKTFPLYHPYPNVALSCVLDFNAIKNKLTTKQKNYFFKAIIDSVVYDTDEYDPIYFIELDSIYHDSENSKTNDKMKNDIFKAANVKLIRIRAYDIKEITVKKFKKLVKEVMREL